MKDLLGVSPSKGNQGNIHTYIHTYIHTLLSPPQWGFSGTIIKLQLKLIKFKKTLTTLSKIVINKNTKHK